MFGVPVECYGVTLLDWSITELNQLNVKCGKLLSLNGAHHMKGDVDSLYLTRKLGVGDLYPYLMLSNGSGNLYQTISMIIKIFNLKKGIGIEGEKSIETS